MVGRMLKARRKLQKASMEFIAFPLKMQVKSMYSPSDFLWHLITLIPGIEAFKGGMQWSMHADRGA